MPFKFEPPKTSYRRHNELNIFDNIYVESFNNWSNNNLSRRLITCQGRAYLQPLRNDFLLMVNKCFGGTWFFPPQLFNWKAILPIFLVHFFSRKICGCKTIQLY